MGIISTKAHTVIGLTVGFILLLAPHIFGFADHSTAAAIATWVGVFIILSELVTKSPYSPIKLVSMKTHLVVDVLTGLFLMASPWLFDFADANYDNRWVPHLVVGIFIMSYALLTNTNNQNVRSIERDL